MSNTKLQQPDDDPPEPAVHGAAWWPRMAWTDAPVRMTLWPLVVYAAVPFVVLWWAGTRVGQGLHETAHRVRARFRVVTR